LSNQGHRCSQKQEPQVPDSPVNDTPSSSKAAIPGSYSTERINSLESLSQIAQYRVLRHIRDSVEGSIKLVQHRETGVLRVYKRYHGLDDKEEQEQRNWPREVRALMTLNQAYAHPHVISMVFADRLADYRYPMCTEYYAGGDLHDQLERFREHGMITPVVFMLQCLINVGEALAFVHHAMVPSSIPGCFVQVKGVPGNLCHLDVKPGISSSDAL